MEQHEIIVMARQVGYTPFEALKWEQALTNFAKLVAAKEREACLKICEAQASTNYWEGADVCAEAIQARGEA